MKRIVPFLLLVVFLLIVFIVTQPKIAPVNFNKILPEIEELPQTVVRVVDGDTLVLLNGRVVRLVGIDTPEYDKYYYEEAAERLAELVEGRNVTLERDASNVDNYGRLLRYVYVNDTFVNLAMVREGYARVLIIYPDDKYAKELKEAMLDARSERLGIWNK